MANAYNYEDAVRYNLPLYSDFFDKHWSIDRSKAGNHGGLTRANKDSLVQMETRREVVEMYKKTMSTVQKHNNKALLSGIASLFFGYWWFSTGIIALALPVLLLVIYGVNQYWWGIGMYADWGDFEHEPGLTNIEQVTSPEVIR